MPHDNAPEAAYQADSLELSIGVIDRSRVPHADQWFGYWAMEEKRFFGLGSSIGGLDISAHLRHREMKASTGGEPTHSLTYTVELIDGVAILDVAGSLMKHEASMEESTSTLKLRRTLRALAGNDRVQAIMLRIDSPGGTVSGTQELADEVAATAALKPVHAYIEDMGASAAYWVASQANHITANRTALVGSIGTYGVVYDASAMAAMKGIKVHVIHAGKFKGSGVPGSEVTPEQLGEWQRVIDGLNSHFLAGVMKGRRMNADQVASLADGRVHVGEEARKLGLIDAVGNFDHAMGELRRKGTKREYRADTSTPASAVADEVIPVSTQMESQNMADTNNTAADAGPATIAELEAAIKDGTADFFVSCMKKNMSVQQAKDAWTDTLRAQLQNRDSEITELKKKQPAGSRNGNPPLRMSGTERGADAQDGDSTEGGDPIAEWKTKVAAKAASGMSNMKAVAAVDRENTGLRQRMVEAHNANNNRTAQLRTG